MIVYCIKNKVNSKEYIGLTTRELQSRWNQHLYESHKEDSWEWNTALGNAIKKYGKDSFDVFVLENCATIEELKDREIKLIAERKTFVRNGGYNMTKGGDGRLGHPHSKETKDKISFSQKGKIISDELKLKFSLAKQGKYIRGKHPKAVKLLINGKEMFDCIRDFSEKYNIPTSTINNKFRQGLVSFELKGMKIQKVNK